MAWVNDAVKELLAARTLRLRPSAARCEAASRASARDHRAGDRLGYRCWRLETRSSCRGRTTSSFTSFSRLIRIGPHWQQSRQGQRSCSFWRSSRENDPRPSLTTSSNHSASSRSGARRIGGSPSRSPSPGSSRGTLRSPRSGRPRRAPASLPRRAWRVR